MNCVASQHVRDASWMLNIREGVHANFHNPFEFLPSRGTSIYLREMYPSNQIHLSNRKYLNNKKGIVSLIVHNLYELLVKYNVPEPVGANLPKSMPWTCMAASQEIPAHSQTSYSESHRNADT